MVRKNNSGAVAADEAKTSGTIDTYNNMYHCCKRCERKRQKKTRHLPQEMVFQFLLHLPALFLHDVVSHVCREWSLIIHSPHFAHRHYRNSTGGVLIQPRCTPREGLYLEMRRGCLEICKFDCGFRGVVRTSCNGLVVISDWGPGPSITYTSNPVTKQSTVLPPFSAHFRDLGLAFVEATMVYKVVRACGYESLVPRTQIAILTIGVNKDWRHIDMKHLLPSEKEGHFFAYPLVTGGYVHWATRRFVLTLNVETETVCRFSPPPLTKFFGTYLPMGSINLSFIHSCDGFSRDVWEMDSATGEWTVWLRYDHKPLHDRFEGMFGEYNKSVVALCWLAAREVLILSFRMDQRRGIAYNVKSGEIKVFELEDCAGSYHFEAHVSSLLWWE